MEAHITQLHVVVTPDGHAAVNVLQRAHVSECSGLHVIQAARHRKHKLLLGARAVNLIELVEIESDFEIRIRVARLVTAIEFGNRITFLNPWDAKDVIRCTETEVIRFVHFGTRTDPVHGLRQPTLQAVDAALIEHRHHDVT